MNLGWPTHPAADLFPLLEGEQLQELADDIKANGLLEPVWLYDDPDRGTVLLDGRNRAAACARTGVEVRTRHYCGDDPIGFSISQNVKRRHLNAGQRDLLALEVEPLYAAWLAKRKARLAAEAAARKERDEHGRIRRQIVANPPQSGGPSPVPHLRARDLAAKAAGASGRGISRVKRVLTDAPELAAQIRAGKLAADRADRIMRDREAEQRRIAKARAEAAATNARTRVDLRHGDFREVLADLADVDAIVTDPPYPHEFLPLLDDLAAWADKVLRPDGVLAVLIGQTHLPEVFRRLEGHRPYRWTGCYITAGSGYVSHPRKVQSNWKPLIVYGGGPRFADVVRSEGSDAHAKALHKWGQDYSAFHTIIERLTERGQTVADPFMGAGTTLLAAHALGRHAVGADIAAEHVHTARERLG